MKDWQIKLLEEYIKEYNEASSYGGGLYVTNDENGNYYVGDSFGPMGPGRYTSAKLYYWTIPFTRRIKARIKHLFNN